MFSTELTTTYPEVITFLTNAIKKNKLANSYIFIGKDLNDISSIAIYLSKILNCKENANKRDKPCGICTNCKWLEKKEHPQAFITISPDSKSKKEQIKIDIVRELLNTLKITSEFFRVIFFESSNLNTLPPESCNLLLKTVEETPERTIFIFANATKNDILSTILSRSQIIYINKRYDSITETINSEKIQLADSPTKNCFSNTIKDCLEKIKKTQDHLGKNEIDLKDYLTSLALINYDTYKYEYPGQFCLIYEGLSNAYLKHKQFMQPKIVIEDLFLSLCTA